MRYVSVWKRWLHNTKFVFQYKFSLDIMNAFRKVWLGDTEERTGLRVA
jgi:hypothetical protein